MYGLRPSYYGIFEYVIMGSRIEGNDMATALDKPHLAADLAVTLDGDRPGTLAKALACVSAAGINIDGYSEMGGVVHVLVTDLVATRRCLSDAGLREVQEQDVIVIPVADQPGAAARVFQQIADAHINVRYSYLATGNRLVISAPDPQAVLKAISS